MAIGISFIQATNNSVTVQISGTNTYYELCSVYILLAGETSYRTLSQSVSLGASINHIQTNSYQFEPDILYRIYVHIQNDKNINENQIIPFEFNYGYQLLAIATELKQQTTSTSFMCSVIPVLNYGIFYPLFYPTSSLQAELDCSIIYSIPNLNINNRNINGKTFLDNYIISSGAKANTVYIISGSVSLTYIGKKYSTNFSVSITTKSRPVLFTWLISKTKGTVVSENLLAAEWSGISTLADGSLYYSLQANINLMETHKGLVKTDWTGLTASSKGKLTADMYNKVATAINNLYSIDYPLAIPPLKTDYKKGDPVTAQCLNDLMIYLNRIQ